MIFNLDDSGGPMTENAIDFASEDFDFASDGAGAWEASFNASGTLRFKADPGLVDLVLVAGGKPGELGSSGIGGVGGKGGEVKVIPGVRLSRGVIYTVVIGGSGEDTSISDSGNLSYTAVSGNGGTAGTPSSNRSRPPVAGGPGTEVWAGEHLLTALNGVKFGPGGGAGGYCASDYAYYDGSAGGETGGPSGGSAGSGGGTNPSTGTAGNGCGGGGAYRNDASNATHDGSVGLGSSGRLLIRSHVEAAS